MTYPLPSTLDFATKDTQPDRQAAITSATFLGCRLIPSPPGSPDVAALNRASQFRHTDNNLAPGKKGYKGIISDWKLRLDNNYTALI